MLGARHLRLFHAMRDAALARYFEPYIAPLASETASVGSESIELFADDPFVEQVRLRARQLKKSVRVRSRTHALTYSLAHSLR
jgi:hypothetical protein